MHTRAVYSRRVEWEDGHPPRVAVALSIRLALSRSVRMCDTCRPSTSRNPSNHVPVDNEDYVITSESTALYDVIHCCRVFESNLSTRPIQGALERPGCVIRLLHCRVHCSARKCAARFRLLGLIYGDCSGATGFGMAPEGHLSYSAGLHMRARRTPLCSVRGRIDPIPLKG